jgi:hypothetical protein
MELSGNHTIVVDIRPVPSQDRCRVFFMNSRQLRQFVNNNGVISAAWMPFDHIAELTASDPIARFEVSGNDEWIVVIERSTAPMIALDGGTDLALQSWRPPALTDTDWPDSDPWDKDDI